jgi:hypothetical protein
MAASNGFDAYQHESGGQVSVEKFELLRVRSEIAVASTYRLRGLGSDAEICLSLTRKYAKGVSSRTDKQWHKSLSVPKLIRIVLRPNCKRESGSIHKEIYKKVPALSWRTMS